MISYQGALYTEAGKQESPDAYKDRTGRCPDGFSSDKRGRCQKKTLVKPAVNSNKKAPAKPGVRKSTLDSLYKHVHSGVELKLTPELIKELSPYRPSKPITLYKGLSRHGGLGFTLSWTKDPKVAKRFAGKGGRVISKTFNPNDIIVDLEQMHNDRGWNDNMILKEKEVLIKPGRGVK